MKKKILLLFVFLLSACGSFAPAETPTPAPTLTPQIIYVTATPEPTLPTTPTFTPTITNTPEPTITLTPEFTFPTVTVNKEKAHCRYGPSVAYLHAADLFAGDVGEVRSQAFYSKWLYIKFDKLNYFCWVAPSVVDVVGDVSTLKKVEPNLQSIGSNMYGAPQNVQAYRNGDEVTITWDQVEMTKDDDRGYLIEAFVCQDTFYIWWTDDLPKQDMTSYTVKDEDGCVAESYGKIYTVEKHGYSQPVDIPWPKHP
jgi:hypothetical protein